MRNYGTLSLEHALVAGDNLSFIIESNNASRSSRVLFCIYSNTALLTAVFYDFCPTKKAMTAAAAASAIIALVSN